MHAENIIDTVKKNPLVKKYINGELTEKVYFINADGGYGKTTALNCLYYYLVNIATSGNHIVPIFIDVKLLMDFGDDRKNEGLGNMPRPLEKYIVKNYCGQDSDPNETLLEKVINLFSNNSPKFNNGYTYYIFVDGINEVDDSTKSIILSEIKEMLECGRVKFFISSRTDEKELPDETVKYKLMPLAEENIRKYLDNNFGRKYGEKVNISKINNSLVEILRVPMYLSVFRKTYDEKSPYPDIYKQTTVRKADLLDSYVQKILNDNKEKERKEYNPLIEFAIKYFLPALAFKAYKDHSSMQISDKEFRDLRKDTDYFDSLLVPDELIDCCKSNNTAIKGICLNLGLVHFVNGFYTFTHQNWRDLFAAKHIINCMNAEKLDELEESVYPNIRQFVGELIREYDGEFKYSKNYDDENDKRKCECDFEKKDNLKTWNESPIEHYMQHSNLGDSPIVTKNLIEIMITSRNRNVTCSYDGLDLKYVSFYKCNLKGSTLNNTKVYSYNFISSGHKSFVNNVAFSPDGTKIVFVGMDNTICMWDVKLGLPIEQLFLGDTFGITSVAFSPDSTKIVSGSDDKNIRIWDVETGSQIGETITGHNGFVNSVAFSSDSKKIASGSNDNTIRIWNADTGIQIGEPLAGHYGSVISVAFSQDGKKIVSGSADETIRIWNVETGLQIGEPITGHTGLVNSVAFSLDGTKIVSGSSDKTIRICDVKTGLPIGEPLTGHTSRVNSVAFSSDGKKIVSGSSDNTTRIWSVANGSQVGESLTGYTAHFLSNDTKIVSVSNDETIRIWNVGNGLKIEEIPTGRQAEVVTLVAFSFEGTKLASASRDGTIRIWDTETGSQIGEPIVGHAYEVNSIVFSSDGKKIVSGSEDKTIRIWDVETGLQIGKPLTGHTRGVISVAISPDDTKIVSGSADKTICIWNTETCKQIGNSLVGHNEWVESIAFSPDGTKILSSGMWDKAVRIWDIETGNQIGERLIVHTDCITPVFFSPNGTKVVSGIWDETKRIWEVDTDKKAGKLLTTYTGVISFVAFSPDGTKIAIANQDKTIQIWEAEKSEHIGACLTGHTNFVKSAAFSPDGNKLASCDLDGIIRIWDLTSNMCRIIEPISSCITNCDFRNVTYSGKEKDEFYKIIYSNGGIVKKEYEPNPIPFEYNEEN